MNSSEIPIEISNSHPCSKLDTHVRRRPRPVAHVQPRVVRLSISPIIYFLKRSWEPASGVIWLGHRISNLRRRVLPWWTGTGCNVTSCHRWGYLLRIDPCHQGGSVFPSKETNDRIRVPRRVGDFNAWFRVSRLPSCIPLSIIFVWRNIYHRNWNNFCLRFLSSELLENRISMWFLSSMDFRFYYITFDRRRLMRLLIILSIWRVLRIRNFFKQRWKP